MTSDNLTPRNFFYLKIISNPSIQLILTLFQGKHAQGIPLLIQRHTSCTLTPPPSPTNTRAHFPSSQNSLKLHPWQVKAWHRQVSYVNEISHRKHFNVLKRTLCLGTFNHGSTFPVRENKGGRGKPRRKKKPKESSGERVHELTSKKILKCHVDLTYFTNGLVYFVSFISNSCSFDRTWKSNLAWSHTASFFPFRKKKKRKNMGALE